MGQSNSPMGEIKGEQLEVIVDGDRVHLFDWDNDMKGFAVRTGIPTPRIAIKAGFHTVGVTFIATNYAPGNDLNNAFLRSTILSSPIPGFTRYPHVGQVRIDGPFDAKGAADTPSRRKIFVCRPTGAKDEETCARQIVTTLAKRAFRRPPTPQRKVKDPAVLEQQVKRMLADPKSASLIANYTGQWLNVRSLQTDAPTVALYPDFDDNLRQAMRREVELFFDSIVHEDRSVL